MHKNVYVLRELMYVCACKLNAHAHLSVFNNKASSYIIMWEHVAMM